MLTKKTLLVRSFASPDKSRPELSGVLIFKDGAVATDSYTLAEIRMKKPLLAADFTAPVGNCRPQEMDDSMILPVDFVDGLAKAINPSPTLPALDCVAYGGKDAGGDPVFLTTDLETSREHKTRAIEGRFPEYLKLIPKGAPLATVSLAPDYLFKAAKMLVAFNKKGLGFPRVEIAVYGQSEPVILTSETADHKATVLIMPIRH